MLNKASKLKAFFAAGVMTATMLSMGTQASAQVIPLPSDDEAVKVADETIEKAIKYFREKQLADGSWMANEKYGVTKPAITGLITAGFIRAGVSPSDPTVKKAIEYLLANQKEDGSFYHGDTGVMPNYNTALTLLAIGRLRDDPKINEAVLKAHKWAEGSQWQSGEDQLGQTIDKNNRNYGGFGYGKHGRPDMSNTSFMLEALYDSGYDCESPAFQRAMTFISRAQGTEQNDMFGDDIVNNGGFIYSLSINNKTMENHKTLRTEATVGLGKNMKAAGVNPDGSTRLQTYGSMTYAGFKSMLYAKLGKDDPRVQAAIGFIKDNYTLKENPNVGMQGYFYNYYVMARALHAWGERKLEMQNGTHTDWAIDMIYTAKSMQNEDGSFINDKARRWMEDEPELVTAYVLLGLVFAKDAVDGGELNQRSQPIE